MAKDEETSTVIAVLVMLGVIAGSSLRNTAPTPDSNDALRWAERWSYQCTVQGALAGEILLCNDSTAVRLIGVDAPEMSYGEIGSLSARATLSVAPLGSMLYLVLDQVPSDQHGRVLAYAILPDRRLLNALIVEAGYALAIPQPPNLARQAEIDIAGERARSESRGLWPRAVFQCFAAGNSASSCQAE